MNQLYSKLSLAYCQLHSWYILIYIYFIEYIKRVGLTLSILFNVILGGDMHQTFSTRNWQRSKDKKFNLVWIIDFFLGTGHCMESWIKWQIMKNKK